jgi:para-aminobenzoate synthetase component 2
VAVAPVTRILVVDNYDSFVFNLVHYLAELGAEVTVHRNDELTVGQIQHGDWDGIVLSPGPGHPDDAGVCIDVIRTCGEDTPILGVCLGHQAIGAAFGGRVEPAEELLHGKTSLIHHRGGGVFRGLPNPFRATRYHSLAVTSDCVPADLEVTARTPGGIVMGLRHRDLPIEGVQFHPESVLTVGGHQLLANWLAGCGLMAAPARVAELAERLDAQRRDRVVAAGPAA